MPRNISGPLIASFTSPSRTIATCLKITRLDGNVLGFTNLDVSLTVDSIVYSPISSVSSTALKQTSDTGVDNLELFGVLNSDYIDEIDLRAGRYDNALIDMFQVDFEHLARGLLTLISGKLGAVTLNDFSYQVEVMGWTQQLKQYVGDVSSASCRCKRLGDVQCKATVPFVNTTVTSISGEGRSLHTGTTIPTSYSASGYYTNGIIKVLSGDNINLERGIKRHIRTGSLDELIVDELFPFPVLVGTTIRVEAGCDRRFITCIQKFDNAINFHGEPHLPGNDTTIQTARPSD